MTVRGPLRYAWLAAVVPMTLPCAAQEYQDWTVQCDNVNHCEAAGYGPDGKNPGRIAMQIVRDAGPATPVQVKFILAEDGHHGMKWVWTGRGFELLSLNHVNHCRGMPDRIDHRKWTARMVR